MSFNSSKLSLCAGLMLASAPLLHAGTMGDIQEQPAAYSFFVGATAGMAMHEGTYRAVNAIGDFHYSKNGGDSFLGGGIAGIETKISDFYVALVGNALYNSLSTDGRVSTNAVGVRNHVFSYKNDFQYGGNVRVGTNIWNATPYFMAGVEAGRWEMNLSNRSATFNRGIAPFSSTTYKETLVGPQVGLGVLLSANDYSVGMEYAHTWFGSVDKNLVTPVTGAVWSHRHKVEQNQVLISAAYKFNAF